jgi:hypothetical protein
VPLACHARAALDAISVQQNGKAAAATTIARKRSVFANVIRYTVELEEMSSNPLDRLSWTPPKISEVVDRRVVVNPRQADTSPGQTACRAARSRSKRVPHKAPAPG